MAWVGADLRGIFWGIHTRKVDFIEKKIVHMVRIGEDTWYLVVRFSWVPWHPKGPESESARCASSADLLAIQYRDLLRGFQCYSNQRQRHKHREINGHRRTDRHIQTQTHVLTHRTANTQNRHAERHRREHVRMRQSLGVPVDMIQEWFNQ